jgi:transaldolase
VRILLESASLAELVAAREAGVIDGAYVTPGALDRDAFGVDAHERITAIARQLTAPVYAIAGAVVAEDLYTVGRELGRVGEDLTVVLPCVEDGLVALRRLATEGVRTAAAFVVTPAQAVLATKRGATAVCVAMETLDRAGHDAAGAVADTVALFARHAVAADVIAIAGDHPRLAAAALAVGADAIAVTPDALQALGQHPLTDRAVDQMLGELSRRPRTRGR